jgi:purine-nucleoside phosphorylase
VRVGPIVSSDVFYNPNLNQYQRWSDRGILAVEMEAAMLFTLGALKKIQTGCLLIVSDLLVAGEFVRISDQDMQRAVDQMTELALETVSDSSSWSTRSRTTVRPAAAGRSSPGAPPPWA